MSQEVITQGVVITETPEKTEQRFPSKFLGFNAEYGCEALKSWLDKQDAPTEIKDLAEGLRGVIMLMEDSEDGFIPEPYTEVITDNLAKIGRGIRYTGVSVHTPDSIMQL